MNNLTIGWLKSVKITNGERIEAFDEVEAHKVAVNVKSKENLPALYVYQGVKGTYSPSNIFFVDIDTTEGVDKIIECSEELFSKIPFIYAIQKSASGKLHIIGVYNETKPDAETWKYDTIIYSLVICRLIKTIFDIDYISLDALDKSLFKYEQGFFFTKNPLIVNEYVVPGVLTDGGKIKIKQEYPEYFESFRNQYEDIDTVIKDIDIDFNAVTGKLLIDRNYTIGKYNGNDLRWRIGSYLVCTYGKEQAQVIVNHLFEKPDDFTFYNKGINQLVKNWFENTFPFVKSKSFVKQEENRITRIEMDDDKFMSDYVNNAEKFIAKEQVLTISAPTGTGKTTMLEKLTKKYHKNSIILVPFNVTNKLYAWSNIVSSESESSFEPGKINTMVWDQFVKHYNEIENSPVDVIFVDESHTLFLDRTYRDSAVQVWGKFQMWLQRGKKIVFISATPAGEIQKLNSRVLKFVKKDDRDVKVNILYTNDTLSSLERDLRNNFFDRVCVFSDRDVKILYARLCADGLSHDARIYHSQWRENVEELKKDECLDRRMNLLTCIAFNGLNIRNKGEKICISMRYTEGDTTLNEIIQIVGRFRNNKDITLNIYVDDKFKSFADLEELFHNAKTITDYEYNAELKSEYFERLSEETVQNSLREIDAYEKMWTLGRIMSELKSYYLVKIETVRDKVDTVKRINPIKKRASELMVGFLRGEMTVGEFEREYRGTDMEDFILQWRRELNNVKYLASGCERVVEAVVEECGKQNTLVDNAIKKMKRIIWVVGMDEVQWGQEVAGRDGLKKLLKGDKMVKSALSNWKKDDSMREKYAGYMQEYVEGSVVGMEVCGLDVLFQQVVEDIKKDKDQTFNNRSVASSKKHKKHKKHKQHKQHKQHKLHMFKCVETGVSKAKPEWMQELECNEDRFNYLIKRGLYVRE